MVVGYHGCNRETAKRVLWDGEPLKPSQNDYDWLGEGVYLWEHGAKRALEFAREQERGGKIEGPSCSGPTSTWADAST